MSIFSGLIDDVVDWWTGDDILGDIIGSAGDAFFGGGGGSGDNANANRPRLQDRVPRFKSGRGGKPGNVGAPGVTQTDEYRAMRDDWRARLRRAQDFADTTDEVIRAPRRS